ncbi:threonine/homoserine/homoserine lactone efflux protein [Neorhizobium sp. 2083]|uniref:LysE family translocator n=1 Tax=Neorhizobium sp. 2083 TaxID=2817762 RepID=UPI002855C5CB|nr:LysE family transporter [Neorhizobium sp. 2083]MDR6820847.1 threonine/homoserine/homoserine lactone efflux protein [Neorhizobium sp. 2083]
MSEIATIVSILGVFLLGAMSPGPSFVVVSRIAVSGERTEGLAAAIGMGVGGFIFAAIAVAGLTALLVQLAWLDIALRIGGGAYLLWIGIKIWRGANEPLEISNGETVQAGSFRRALVRALLVQLANPKTAIFYASMFAAMLPASPPLWMLLVLPPLLFCNEFAWYAIVAFALSSHGPRSIYLRAKRWIDRAAGAVVGALGMKLMIEGMGAMRTGMN